MFKEHSFPFPIVRVRRTRLHPGIELTIIGVVLVIWRKGGKA